MILIQWFQLARTRDQNVWYDCDRGGGSEVRKTVARHQNYLWCRQCEIELSQGFIVADNCVIRQSR